MTLRFDASLGHPAMFGEGEPPFPPEYLVLAMPAGARCEESPGVDDPHKLIARVLNQLEAGVMVSSEHELFQEAKRRILSRGYIEVPDEKWPFTFLVGGFPQRLVVSLTTEVDPAPKTPFTARPMTGFTRL